MLLSSRSRLPDPQLLIGKTLDDLLNKMRAIKANFVKTPILPYALALSKVVRDTNTQISEFVEKTLGASKPVIKQYYLQNRVPEVAPSSTAGPA